MGVGRMSKGERERDKKESKVKGIQTPASGDS